MKNLACYFIAVMICLPAIALADDSKYLAGAVPEVNGKVVFAKDFNLPGVEQDSIYDYVYSWLDKQMKAKNNDSRIVIAEKGKGQILASGEESLVFSNTAFSFDESHMSYNILVLCKPGKCEIRVERIRFNYEDEKHMAEDMISDKAALNKKKTTMFRGYKKFRIKTVDFVEELFTSLQLSLGAK